MRTLAAIAIALALAAAGCGGDDEGGGSGDAGSPEQVVKRWMLEGDCDLMTDRFLEAQLLGLGKARQDRCELFEKQHTKPRYGEDEIQITDVKVSGDRASLVVGSENAPDIKSKYDLVRAGGRWRIDAAELQ